MSAPSQSSPVPAFNLDESMPDDFTNTDVGISKLNSTPTTAHRLLDIFGYGILPLAHELWDMDQAIISQQTPFKTKDARETFTGLIRVLCSLSPSMIRSIIINGIYATLANNDRTLERPTINSQDALKTKNPLRVISSQDMGIADHVISLLASSYHWENELKANIAEEGTSPRKETGGQSWLHASREMRINLGQKLYTEVSAQVLGRDLPTLVFHRGGFPISAPRRALRHLLFLPYLIEVC